MLGIVRFLAPAFSFPDISRLVIFSFDALKLAINALWLPSPEEATEQNYRATTHAIRHAETIFRLGLCL